MIHSAWVHVASDICRKMDAGRFDDMEMSSFLMYVSFDFEVV